MDNSNKGFYTIIISLLLIYFICFAWINHTPIAFRRYATRKKPSISTNDYLTFVQITDTHINYRTQEEDYTRLAELLNGLNPNFVIHSGDIIDGITKHRKEMVIEEDFKVYKRFKEKIISPYFDVRGNHDTFNGDRKTNKYILETYIRNRSEIIEFSGGNTFVIPEDDNQFKSERNYYKVIIQGDLRYLFIFLDCTPIVGPGSFFNFFGHYKDKKFSAQIQKVHDVTSFHQVFIINHYPSNCLFSSDDKIFNASILLNGHLHNILFDRFIYKESKNRPREYVLEDYLGSKKIRFGCLYDGEFYFNDFEISRSPCLILISAKAHEIRGLDIKFMLQDGERVEIKYEDILYNFDLSKIEENENIYFFKSVEKFYHLKFRTNMTILKTKKLAVHIKAINQYGSCSDKTCNKARKLNILDISAFYPIIFLLVTYFLIILQISDESSMFYSLIRLVAKLVLPTYLMFFYDYELNFIYFFGVKDIKSLDVMAYFSIFLFLDEVTFSLAYNFENGWIVQLIIYVAEFLFTFFYAGILMRLEDVFMMFYLCRRVLQNRKIVNCNRDRSWLPEQL